MRRQWTSIDTWASDPRNVAALAVDLLPVIRKHAATERAVGAKIAVK